MVDILFNVYDTKCGGRERIQDPVTYCPHCFSWKNGSDVISGGSHFSCFILIILFWTMGCCSAIWRLSSGLSSAGLSFTTKSARALCSTASLSPLLFDSSSVESSLSHLVVVILISAAVALYILYSKFMVAVMVSLQERQENMENRREEFENRLMAYRRWAIF